MGSNFIIKLRRDNSLKLKLPPKSFIRIAIFEKEVKEKKEKEKKKDNKKEDNKFARLGIAGPILKILKKFKNKRNKKNDNDNNNSTTSG